MFQHQFNRQCPLLTINVPRFLPSPPLSLPPWQAHICYCSLSLKLSVLLFLWFWYLSISTLFIVSLNPTTHPCYFLSTSFPCQLSFRSFFINLGSILIYVPLLGTIYSPYIILYSTKILHSLFVRVIWRTVFRFCCHWPFFLTFWLCFSISHIWSLIKWRSLDLKRQFHSLF